MPLLVQLLQAFSGALWLLPMALLAPRVVAAWRKRASRVEMLSTPIFFLSLVMVGYSVRWAVWPHAIEAMNFLELVTWAALYALSGTCALWFAVGALQTRGE